MTVVAFTRWEKAILKLLAFFISKTLMKTVTHDRHWITICNQRQIIKIITNADIGDICNPKLFRFTRYKFCDKIWRASEPMMRLSCLWASSFSVNKQKIFPHDGKHLVSSNFEIICTKRLIKALVHSAFQDQELLFLLAWLVLPTPFQFLSVPTNSNYGCRKLAGI